MGQLGSMQKWLIALMKDNYDLDFPFLLTKLRIAVGIWRLVVSHLQAWEFYYILPVSDGRPVSLDEA